MIETPLKKVAMFITRGKPGLRQLLVFDHAGGTQIPAGTVLDGEAALHAALRVAREQSGLPDLTLIAELGSRRMSLTGDDRVLLADALLQLMPDTSSTVVRGTALRRGASVRLLESDGDFARVLYEETHSDTAGETIVTARRSGWLPLPNVTSTIERHLFHLTSTISTAERWEVKAEPVQPYTLYWVPLKVGIRLLGQQQEWLDSSFRALKG